MGLLRMRISIFFSGKFRAFAIKLLYHRLRQSLSSEQNTGAKVLDVAEELVIGDGKVNVFGTAACFAPTPARRVTDQAVDHRTALICFARVRLWSPWALRLRQKHFV